MDDAQWGSSVDASLYAVSPRLVSPGGGTICPFKKKKVNVAISVKLPSDRPEMCLWLSRSVLWKLSWKGLFHEFLGLENYNSLLPGLQPDS